MRKYTCTEKGRKSEDVIAELKSRLEEAVTEKSGHR